MSIPIISAGEVPASFLWSLGTAALRALILSGRRGFKFVLVSRESNSGAPVHVDGSTLFRSRNASARTSPSEDGNSHTGIIAILNGAGFE